MLASPPTAQEDEVHELRPFAPTKGRRHVGPNRVLRVRYRALAGERTSPLYLLACLLWQQRGLPRVPGEKTSLRLRCRSLLGTICTTGEHVWDAAERRLAGWTELSGFPRPQKGLRPVATRRSEGTAGPEGAKRRRRHQQREKWYLGK